MVDTGRFSYTNTTPTTHRIAADLIGAGADLPTIVDWIWGRVEYPAAKLLGLALSSLQRTKDGCIAWAVLRNEDFLAASASPEDTEGIIDHIRSIKDARVAALFSEKRGSVRVSLRSHGEVDVAKLASKFGGGGHVKAAGLTFNGPIDYAVCEVIRAIEAALHHQ
jgi:phosphoesterase RecJ-like protein